MRWPRSGPGRPERSRTTGSAVRATTPSGGVARPTASLRRGLPGGRLAPGLGKPPPASRLGGGQPPYTCFAAGRTRRSWPRGSRVEVAREPAVRPTRRQQAAGAEALPSATQRAVPSQPTGTPHPLTVRLRETTSYAVRHNQPLRLFCARRKGVRGHRIAGGGPRRRIHFQPRNFEGIGHVAGRYGGQGDP